MKSISMIASEKNTTKENNFENPSKNNKKTT
jgi:hypothetical protein